MFLGSISLTSWLAPSTNCVGKEYECAWALVDPQGATGLVTVLSAITLCLTIF